MIPIPPRPVGVAMAAMVGDSMFSIHQIKNLLSLTRVNGKQVSRVFMNMFCACLTFLFLEAPFFGENHQSAVISLTHALGPDIFIILQGQVNDAPVLG